jgi:hypothetical protein
MARFTVEKAQEAVWRAEENLRYAGMYGDVMQQDDATSWLINALRNQVNTLEKELDKQQEKEEHYPMVNAKVCQCGQPH